MFPCQNAAVAGACGARVIVDIAPHLAEKEAMSFAVSRFGCPPMHLAMRLATTLAAACVSIAALGAAPARADLRVCNDTDVLAGVAIGYRAETGWITEGWWHVESGACKTLIEGPLQSRYYYLYAEDAQRGGRWTGPVNMCIAEKEFKIVGFEDCFARGFQLAGFQEHDTGNQSSWMIQLTDRKEAPAEPAPSGQPAPATGN
jgi:uncharacterized membrane protein